MTHNSASWIMSALARQVCPHTFTSFALVPVPTPPCAPVGLVTAGEGCAKDGGMATATPIETDFIHFLNKKIRDDVDVKSQEWIGRQRPDFIITSPRSYGRTIVECDGREFHKYSDDADRDAGFLFGGHASQIVRFRGCDIHYNGGECIDALESISPEWFNVERKGLSIRDRIDAGQILMLYRQVKPIWRFLMSATDVKRLPISTAKKVLDQCIAVNNGMFVVQFHSKTWKA